MFIGLSKENAPIERGILGYISDFRMRSAAPLSVEAASSPTFGHLRYRCGGAPAKSLTTPVLLSRYRRTDNQLPPRSATRRKLELTKHLSSATERASFRRRKRR